MRKMSTEKLSESPPNTADSELNHNLFEKYDLLHLLGCGAFGKVYHARDIHTGKSVAIKSVSKQKILKHNLTKNITREISIMRNLHHSHIVSLDEVLATKTRVYFVMEFAKGGEIFGKIAKGRFSEDLTRKYFHQLISAVGYCHSRGVFHRDLKPQNLLIDENWDLKVTDFGLSAMTDQIRPDGLLHTMCGTPAYVAPEVLAKKGYDGAKIDVWSCGVILYVFNAGYLPFNSTNLMTMYRKIFRGEFRCPTWTSPDLKRLLTRILDPNPSTRITVQEIKNDPWFKTGYEETLKQHPVVFDREHFDLKECVEESRFLNAFDLLSYSSGADLSGLFSPTSLSESDLFVSDKSPETIIERIGNLALEECMMVAKKGMSLRLQDGNCMLMVEIKRLTKELVVVEVRTRGGLGQEIWKQRLKPKIKNMIYKEKRQVADCRLLITNS